MRFHHFPEIVNIDWEEVEVGWGRGVEGEREEGGSQPVSGGKKMQLTFPFSAQKRNSREQRYLGGLADEFIILKNI